MAMVPYSLYLYVPCAMPFSSNSMPESRGLGRMLLDSS